VFIKNFDQTLDLEGLKKLFQPYGPIKSAVIKLDDQGNPKGFGFCNFENAEDARRAVEGLNGTELNQRKLTVTRHQKKRERQIELRWRFPRVNQGLNLYIKYLSDEVDDQRLYDEFKQFGNITSAKVMKDDKNNSKGFGFVNFSTQDEAARALAEMREHVLFSKRIYVAYYQPREQRDRALQQRGYRAGLSGAYPFPVYQQQPFFPQMMNRTLPPPPPSQNRWAPQQMMPRSRGSGGQRGRGYHTRGPQQSQMDSPEQQQLLQQQQQQLLLLQQQQQQQPLPERLYELIFQLQPAHAPKITGMILESSLHEDLVLLTTNPDALRSKVSEALSALSILSIPF